MAPATGRWRIYQFSSYRSRVPGGSDLNFLDNRFAQAWIDVEHSLYAERFGEHLGTTMPGVFIDLEGSFGCKLAYSHDLAAKYLEQTGRDIRLWLPLLIDEDAAGLWGKARWDWFRAVSEVYVESVFAPLDRWCEQHGMYMTCHLWEDNLVAQALQTRDFFAAQRSYILPRTDSLFLGATLPRDFKESQVVAEFEGRQLMCEILGVAGWHLSRATIRHATNCAIAWGVTHFVPHAISSQLDLRTVSYPPDFFDWNPYWRHFEQWTDYCRRASYLNGQGHLAADVLLLCPMDSVWALLGDGLFDADNPIKGYIIEGYNMEDSRHAAQLTQIEAAYNGAMNDLAQGRIEYLVSDCEYLRQMNLSEDGGLRGGEFAIHSIVLPPLVMLPIDIAQGLLDFAAAGGHVYTLGGLPHASTENGMNDPYMESLMESLQQAPTTLDVPNGLAALLQTGTPGLRPHVGFLAGDFPLLQQHRRIDGRDFYCLVNTTDAKHDCSLLLADVQGGVTRWDC